MGQVAFFLEILQNHSTQLIFGTPWRDSYRSETTEINELESGDTPRVSGHPKRISTGSEEVVASRRQQLFGLRLTH